jgi:hypothetical protein
MYDAAGSWRYLTGNMPDVRCGRKLAILDRKYAGCQMWQEADSKRRKYKPTNHN